MDPNHSDRLIGHREVVQDAWIDYNGHMNVAYYVLAFDHATDAALDALGLGADYAEGAGKSIFVADMQVSFRREVHAGDMLSFETRLLGHDEKRLHLFHTMFGGQSSGAAATTELMCLHVDLESRRVVPFPPARQAAISALWEAQKGLERPDGVGRVINSLL